MSEVKPKLAPEVKANTPPAQSATEAKAKAAPAAVASAEPKKDEEKVEIETSKKTVNILVCTADLNLAKTIQTIYQAVIPANGENPCRIFPGTTKEKIVESLTKYTFHSIIVDEDFMPDTTPEKWGVEFAATLKKFPNNAEVPVILSVMKIEPHRVRELVRGGWKDVLVKPLDSQLFMQKLAMYNPKQEVLKEPLLFSMDAAKVVDLAMTYKTKTISEYGVKVESPQDMVLGTVVGVQSGFFPQQLSAVVVSSKKGDDKMYAIDLMFVGVTPAETQMIRKFIRQEYAEEKQAA